ncbi:Uncharacterised protein [Mycobacterium tuberculosis]|nr:Uncharacterised protein [Mycobacterium tuberculosis]
MAMVSVSAACCSTGTRKTLSTCVSTSTPTAMSIGVRVSCLA